MHSDCDVLVVGGGPAGIGAAIAAARHGTKTILIERYGCLGGMATGGYVLSMEGLPVGGIMDEIMLRLCQMDGAVGNQICPEMLKILADEMCIEAGIKLVFHSLATSVDMMTNEVVTVHSKSGVDFYEAKIIIDCTGDGDIAAKAGATWETGTKTIGMNFLVANILPYPNQGIWQPEHYPASDSEIYWINVTGVQDRESKEWPIDLTGQLSAIDVDDLTYAEIENRRRIYQTFREYRERKPGWQDARLVAMASQLGVRESRRIIAREKVMEQQKYANAICAVGTEERYQIPYGALVPAELNNFLVAGRCISCKHEAHDNIRLIPACIATGQAAGTAAAMCYQQDILPRELEVSELQGQLKKDGVLLE